ncbi:MAG: hypothetical protein IPM37_12635, partial [Hahellaceae bacterium]|nr:hypothetical protein [Hahellaceae bacterium]
MARPSSYKTPSGATRYRIRFQVDGQTIDKGGFRTATDARAFQKEESAKLRLRMRNTGAQLVNELIDRYYAGPFNELAPGTRKSRKTELEHWRGRLGNRKASEITPAIIADEIDQLKKRDEPLSSGSIRKYALALRAVFTTAQREWHLLQTNPFEQVKLPADGKARDRTLSDSELAALLRA